MVWLKSPTVEGNEFSWLTEEGSLTERLQKEFNDKWGSLKFGISDIFNQLKYTGGTNLPEQNIKTRNLFRFSNRTFTLTYNRKFGNTKLKSSRNRETGSEEERQRVN